MKIFAAAAIVALIAATGVHAQTVRDKKTCEQAVADAKAAVADADISDRARSQAAELVRVSEHLCTQANFVYAESLLQIARGMTASE